MTDEQIKQNAEEYAELLTAGNKEHYRSIYTAAKEGYETGAHSLDEEIKEMKDELESLRKGFYERGDKLKELMLKNNQLRNPWISVKERLPEDDDLVLTIYWVHKDFYSIELSSYNPETREWDCGKFGYRISHWMPIPQIEKGE